ncbi:PTS sugar transporter subunit IIA [Marinilactibacillus kalidii]|uniref:PTS sugar transporter subunit IIA n=1 Tax=Marinilactibacillus kalidii TaxID=2820274 RepID=UPI001ABE90D5|nr:PTS sugar transporter subunit IIA [Marinilactibacillus kalidii]
MLSQLISQDAIQLDIEAVNWIDAIRKSAVPLLKSNKITNHYVERVIEIAKETGPYIVVAKKIALPHAPSDAGALESSMSITVLNQAVEFGHESNDPVKYLFFLSATDSTSHLEALAALVELLDDEVFLRLLDKSKSSEEVYRYIQNKERS